MVKLLLASFLGLAAAQFPPKPLGVVSVPSRFHENVSISYKEPKICETTPGVKSYAGYVHLPPGLLGEEDREQDYPINTFFWFFEARKDPKNAPVAIWINGGPGESSLTGLLAENGPCIVQPDSKSTRLNPWSWNNEVNMLYLDQPNQVGFSYDFPTNCSVEFNQDWLEFEMIPTDFSGGIPNVNLTSRVGTFGSQNINNTANSTLQAAHVLWHFTQAWFFEFPHYKPANDKISIWTESYGGHFGPGLFQFFQKQNEKIKTGKLKDKSAHYLHLDSLGIVNGLLDMSIQGESYIGFPYNNTYGLDFFDESTYQELSYNWTHPEGCEEQTLACQESLKSGNSDKISEICETALECNEVAPTLYTTLEQGSWVDIAHPAYDPFPPGHFRGWLTQESVLSALGVPVNFTSISTVVSDSFDKTWDMYQGGFLEAVGSLLDNGIKVHMMYGDRDYACCWTGGEAVSLAIQYSRTGDFAKAGYATLRTADGESGMTRQFGNFSFTRVYQAGHQLPAYQPAAAYDIFMRATFDRDIATGQVPVTDELATKGPKDTWNYKNDLPVAPTPKCYVLKPDTCLPDVWAEVEAGHALIKDWYVVEDN